ncbi:glycosyltransferase family 2 protein [bacterium]|nr:glycosyltransferase family 2 protein [bacterium]
MIELPEALRRPSVSLFFPVYNDSRAIEDLARRGSKILAELTSSYEIVIVDDGSRDDSAEIADALARELPNTRVIHHPSNQGYGRALLSGLRETGSMDWICFTDGDHQYDISELRQFMKHLDGHDLLIGFRVDKSYGPVRKALSWGLNALVRFLFHTPYRDVTCGFKMIRSSAAGEIAIQSQNVFAGGEIVMRAHYLGFRIGEIAISMYPRQLGGTTIISLRGVWRTFCEIWAVYGDLHRNQPRPKE